MSRRTAISHLFLGLAVLVHSQLLAEEKLRSSLQPGDKITSIFEPLNVTGPFAGERHCLICENGVNPVAMIFAREISEPLIQLLVKMDSSTAANRDKEMGSFLVLLNDQDNQRQKLQEIAKQRDLKHIVLSMDAPEGPEGFHVSPEADLTVVLYRNFEVKANHAVKKGGLSNKTIEQVVADVPKILAAK